MARKPTSSKRPAPKAAAGKPKPAAARRAGRPSALLDTRIVHCGDCLDQLGKLPDGCVDLIYIDPPFNSNRNYEVFWGETKEKRAFEDRHASAQAFIDYMRPRCQQLARVLKHTGSFYYHCDWRACCRWHNGPSPVPPAHAPPVSAACLGGQYNLAVDGPRGSAHRLLDHGRMIETRRVLGTKRWTKSLPAS